MTKKNIMLILLSIILIFSIGIFYYINENNKDDKASNNNNTNIAPLKETRLKETLEMPDSDYEQKYYIVYIKHEDGSGTSFIPMDLNPDLKKESGYQVSLSIDDNGNIINREKVIEIDNFEITDENRERIKEIAGEENFDSALKEIEDRVNDAKKNLVKEGLL